MTRRITDELEQAISRKPEGTLRVKGANGTYWLMTESAMQMRTEVEKGLADIDRGAVATYTPSAIKQSGRRHLERSPNE